MFHQFLAPLARFGKHSVVLALAFVLVACGSAETREEPSTAVPRVGVYTIEEEALSLRTDLPGRTVPFRVAELRPQVNGIVRERLFVEGSQVEQGQPLYQIDDGPYRAALLRAEANLVSAENLAKRYERLVNTEAVSQQQYDDALAAWRQAQAALEIARIDLQYTHVLSPISGRIGRSRVTEGALVTSGQPQALATVQQLDPIYVDMTQPVGELLRLRRALEEGRLQRVGKEQALVSLQLEDGSRYPHSGSLQFSEVTVDPGTSSVTLRAAFPNPDGVLLPGMFVRANLEEGVQPDAKLVPQQALMRDATGAASVWVVDADNQVSRREVETLRTVGNAWLVGSGLEAGERVIAEGTQLVQSGMTVEAFEATNIQLVKAFSDDSKRSMQ